MGDSDITANCLYYYSRNLYMTNEDNGLLPCPFCGLPPSSRLAFDTNWISCNKNECIGIVSAKYYKHTNACIKAWNTRATTTLIEQLCGALEFYANKETYAWKDKIKGNIVHSAPHDIQEDKGEKAREALETAKNWRGK
jgi:hypothetical protein